MTQTKLSKILTDRGLTQKDLYDLIVDSGHKIGRDTISRIINGKHTNYRVDTLKILCVVLCVTPNDIVDF